MKSAWVRILLATFVAVTSLVSTSAVARAGDADEEKEEIVTLTHSDGLPKKKKVVVVVEDRHGMEGDAPEVGDSIEEIEDYLDRLERREKAFKRDMKEARRSGDDERAESLSVELHEFLRFKAEEKKRLTKKNPGLMAGGGVLVGIGSLAFVVGLVFAIAYGVDDHPGDAVGPAAIGGLLGGVVGIGAGAPMLSIGMKRRPREPSEAYLPSASPIVTGGTLTWSF